MSINHNLLLNVVRTKLCQVGDFTGDRNNILKSFWV
jgi:hypothetical protein